MDIVEVKRTYEDSLLSIPTVVGVGIGLEGIRVYVKDRTQINLIPTTIKGFDVKTIESGELYAFQNNSKWRPISGGVSIGQHYWGTGTLSTLVIDNDSGKKLILSNNHVLARSNNNETSWGKVGDSIIQPGHTDGGREGNPPLLENVAKLVRWVELQTVHWVGDHWEGDDNFVDCALAEPIDEGLISNDISHIGVLSGVRDAQLAMAVRKSGRTTDLTHGNVTDIDFTGVVSYGWFIARFTNQIVVEGAGTQVFSRPGDSGSLVVDSMNNAVGLLFAGNSDTNITICNRISHVLSALNVSLPIGGTPIIQNLVEIVPTAWFDVETSPVVGDIFLDNMYVGAGHVCCLVAAEMPHTISFGDVEGYVTPSPKEVFFQEGEHVYRGFFYHEKPKGLILPLIIGGVIIGSLIFLVRKA